jgi:hypothetical protein
MRQASRAVVGGGYPRRRRHASHLGEPLKKVTLQVRESVYDAVRALVHEGATPSANVFVEEALDQKLSDIRRARVYRDYQRAAKDEAFLAEMEATSRAFEHTVGDGLGRQNPPAVKRAR